MIIFGFNQYLLIIAVVINMITAFNGAAQKYSISPNDSFIDEMPLDETYHFSVHQNNNSSDTLYFGWKKISESIPNGWEVNLCDNNNCYAGRPDSGAQILTFPSEYGQMSMAVSPHQIEGKAYVQYECWEKMSPTKLDTFTWQITSKKSVALQEFKKSSIQISPNPTNQHITIQSDLVDGFTYKIIDGMGRIQIEKNVQQSTENIDVSNLINLNYLLIIEKNNKIVYTNKISILK